ncbi:family 1 glycosylhydrolase [Kineosporia sp. A_224]|uniref:family 1 glycosylhydrolase n=1 Tax=Kineosporia sp. A_224 TaxID=1962180 RepID=UPI000B4B356F|nr:family 1 glycosylhydrolase [Kineosporia sp. A_224]
MIDAVAAAGGTQDDSRVTDAVARLDLSGLADGFVWAIGVTADPTAQRAPGRTGRAGRRAARGGADDEVALLGRAGVDVLAVPVPWASVLPDPAGPADADALARLDRRVDDLLALGVTPWPTLHADDAALPAALRDAGGWASRETALRFADHAATVHALLADRVVTWTTLVVPAAGEPAGDPEGDPDADHEANLLLAHGLGHAAMRAQAPADHRFGVTVALSGGADDDRRVGALLAGPEPLDRLGVHYVGAAPRGLPELLARIRREHPAAPPFLVSTAGGADGGADDVDRVADLLEHLDALAVAARAGVGVRGYVAGPVDVPGADRPWPGLDVLRLAVAAVRPA